MRGMMRAHGDRDGLFCIGARDAFYERDGMRFDYHFDAFGVAGNIDSGGSSEEQTRAKLFSLMQPNGVLYDIGAHEGLFSISLKKSHPLATAYAFEPQTDALLKNLDLNNLNSVRVIPFALGDSVGNVSMTTAERSSNHVTINGQADKSFPVSTIDTLVADLSLKLPSAIKIDIEGFEYRALLGAQRTLSTLVANLAAARYRR